MVPGGELQGGHSRLQPVAVTRCGDGEQEVRVVSPKAGRQEDEEAGRVAPGGSGNEERAEEAQRGEGQEQGVEGLVQGAEGQEAEGLVEETEEMGLAGEVQMPTREGQVFEGEGHVLAEGQGRKERGRFKW